ncbi:MAG TPA: alpha-amylase family glycosyl hydrolase, partial [Thermoproteota archaeon]|nr:alpha-amylase family glycosyl hydrolase [Thermoproteota archaeon]
VLDMVFNHTGRGFFAFRDVVRNQQSSQYVNWYNVHELPVTRKKSLASTVLRKLAGQPDRPAYEAYRDRPDWPELNFRSFEARGFVREIVAHWMKKALLDGVWLPVASGLPHFFLAEVRRTVKRTRADAVLIGDVRGDPATWLNSGELDSATNSVFKRAVAEFFLEGKSSPSEFMAQLTRFRALTPWAATLAECNQIDDEFSPRAVTASGEDKMKAMMAAIFQLTYPGSAAILYGDEIGMGGGQYPDCRQAMRWEASGRDEEVLALYKKLLKVRMDSEAIRIGWLRFLAVDDQFDLLAFQRWTEKDSAVIIIRRTGDPQVIDVPVPDGIYRDVISWETYTVTGGSFRAELRGGSCLVLVGDKATYQGALGPMELSPL